MVSGLWAEGPAADPVAADWLYRWAIAKAGSLQVVGWWLKEILANFSGLFEMAWVLVPAPALPLFLSTRVTLALEMA